MFIPHSALSKETLRAIIEDFVTRDGTDYGEQESSLEQKVLQVYQQLEDGRARISFNPDDESCALVLASDSFEDD